MNEQAEAEIGINVIPTRRRQGLSTEGLRLLVERIWRDTEAQAVVNEFEDERTGAVHLHRNAAFSPADTSEFAGRAVRQWRLPRP